MINVDKKNSQTNQQTATYKPRAPCFNSINSTRYRSDVSNVVMVACRSSRFNWPLNSRCLTLMSSSDAAMNESVEGDSEKMRNFSSALYRRTYAIVRRHAERQLMARNTTHLVQDVVHLGRNRVFDLYACNRGEPEKGRRDFA